jgi:hypothetical protein
MSLIFGSELHVGSPCTLRCTEDYDMQRNRFWQLFKRLLFYFHITLYRGTFIYFCLVTYFFLILSFQDK